MYAVFVYRILSRLLNCRVRGKIQVILRGKIDAANRPAGVVLDRADGLGSLFRGSGIGPIAVLPPGILPAIEGLDAAKQIASLRIAIFAQGAGQRIERFAVIAEVSH